MRIRTDLGQRVELVSMDPSCHDISVGLYRKETEDGPVAVVHSYSTKPGAAERVAFIGAALIALGGLELVDGDGDRALRVPCRHWHNAALKRLFLDCFRVDPATQLEPKPLAAPDTRSEQMITLVPLGNGVYRVDSEARPKPSRRARRRSRERSSGLPSSRRSTRRRLRSTAGTTTTS